jgi:phosphatidylglycerophosphate synthase
MLYKKRDIFENLAIKIALIASKTRLSPNSWTILAIIPASATVYFLINQQWLAAAALFFLTSFIDVIDGSVARLTGNVTKLGAYLDTIVDRYVEAAIILALLFVQLPPLFFPSYIWIGTYLFGSLMTTYAKAAAKEKEIVDKEIKGGILERAERVVLLFVGILLAAFNTAYLTYIIALLAILAHITAGQRIWLAINFRKFKR